MKKTQLYVETTEVLAEARTQEKRRRSGFIVVVITAILLGLIWKGGIPFPVYFILGGISALILWCNKPWAKVSSDEIAESEVLFSLNMQLTKKEKTIRKLNQEVNYLYDNLPRDKDGFIQDRRKILTLNEKLLHLYEKLFEIHETIGVKNDPLIIQNFQIVGDEILSLKQRIK